MPAGAAKLHLGLRDTEGSEDGSRALGEGERPAITPSLSFHKWETEAGRTELIW